MLAEAFMLRLEADLRASKLAAHATRFVPIDPLTLPAVEATEAGARRETTDPGQPRVQ
jgi:hypothetical protein